MIAKSLSLLICIIALTTAVALASNIVQGDDAPLPKPAIAIPVRGKLDPRATPCAECHSRVTAEWAGSAHGLAWLDADYQAAIKKKKRSTRCHSCHRPEPLFATGALTSRVVPRKLDAHMGVSCESCHLGSNGSILGPRGEEQSAHASQRSAFMTSEKSSQLCITCHDQSIGPVVGIADGFLEGSMPARGLSCVGCHMSSSTRRWADGEQHPLRSGRSHALQTPRDPAFLRSAFGLQLVVENDTLNLRILNQAGHQVPGLEGRSLAFTARLLDAQGGEVSRSEFTIDTRAYLAADEYIDLPLKGSGAQVEIVGVHRSPRQKKSIRFLELLIDCP